MQLVSFLDGRASEADTQLVIAGLVPVISMRKRSITPIGMAGTDPRI
jgi:hypothetical protein